MMDEFEKEVIKGFLVSLLIAVIVLGAFMAVVSK